MIRTVAAVSQSVSKSVNQFIVQQSIFKNGFTQNKDLTVCWQVRDRNERNDNTCHANNLHGRKSNRYDSQGDEQRTQLGVVKYRTGCVCPENSLTCVRPPGQNAPCVFPSVQKWGQNIQTMPSCAAHMIWSQFLPIHPFIQKRGSAVNHDIYSRFIASKKIYHLSWPYPLFAAYCISILFYWLCVWWWSLSIWMNRQKWM